MAAGCWGSLESSKEGPDVARRRGDGVVGILRRLSAMAPNHPVNARSIRYLSKQGAFSVQTSPIAAALQVGASRQEVLSANSPVALG